jgi:hypothetical protein
MHPPFADVPDRSVCFLIFAGVQPSRPMDAECDGLPIPDTLWDLVKQCWEPDSYRRPPVHQILTGLHALADT